MNWAIGSTYNLFGRVVRLESAEKAYFDSPVYGTFHGEDGFKATVRLDSLIDKIARENAKTLMAEGWHCISGKHLRIARVNPEVGPLTLAYHLYKDDVKYLRKPTRYRETKIVDVDTYVALKWLRRQKPSWKYQEGGGVSGSMLREGEVAAVLSSEADANQWSRDYIYPEKLQNYQAQMYASHESGFGVSAEDLKRSNPHDLRGRYLDEFQRRTEWRTDEDVRKIIKRMGKKYAPNNVVTIDMSLPFGRTSHLHLRTSPQSKEN